MRGALNQFCCFCPQRRAVLGGLGGLGAALPPQVGLVLRLPRGRAAVRCVGRGAARLWGTQRGAERSFVGGKEGNFKGKEQEMGQNERGSSEGLELQQGFGVGAAAELDLAPFWGKPMEAALGQSCGALLSPQLLPKAWRKHVPVCSSSN